MMDINVHQKKGLILDFHLFGCTNRNINSAMLNGPLDAGTNQQLKRLSLEELKREKLFVLFRLQPCTL